MFTAISLKNRSVLPILCSCLWILLVWHDAVLAQKAPEPRAISVQPASGSGQRRALLVGVNQYERLKDLKYCEADVSAFKDALIRLGFRPNDIKVLATSGSVKTQPTKNNVEEYLKMVMAGLTENDTVIISLSGHGGQFRSVGGDKKVKSASYFCPQDARVDRPEDTMISTRTIFQLLEKSPARFKMLLVDACRDKHLFSEDDPGRSSLDESRTAANFVKSFDTEAMPKGSVAMISCVGGQQSYESPKLGQGVFMYHVVQGSLGEADRDGDGIVSLFELRDYVVTQTSSYTYRELSRPQTPRFHADWEAADYQLFDVSKLVAERKPVSEEKSDETILFFSTIVTPPVPTSEMKTKPESTTIADIQNESVLETTAFDSEEKESHEAISLWKSVKETCMSILSALGNIIAGIFTICCFAFTVYMIAKTINLFKTSPTDEQITKTVSTESDDEFVNQYQFDRFALVDFSLTAEEDDDDDAEYDTLVLEDD